MTPQCPGCCESILIEFNAVPKVWWCQVCSRIWRTPPPISRHKAT